MSDLICRRTMRRCETSGMCSPHGGCQPEKSEWQVGYDEGRRMGTKHMYAEVDRPKADNQSLRKALTYIRDTTDDWHIVEKTADALIDNTHKED